MGAGARFGQGHFAVSSGCQEIPSPLKNYGMSQRVKFLSQTIKRDCPSPLNFAVSNSSPAKHHSIRTPVFDA